MMQLAAYMGRPEGDDVDVSVYRLASGGRIQIDPRAPPEDPADGCPGGWYRSAFASSVIGYLRSRTQHGGRNQNHLLDRADDPLVESAVLMFEAEQERVYGRQSELLSEQRRRELGR